MEYRKINNGSYNIHIIKTDKFNNVRMQVCFQNNIVPEELTKRTFLFDLLAYNSKKYETNRKLNLKCEELYDASVYSKSFKTGGAILNSLIMDILDPAYADDGYYEEAISFLFDLIFEPNINNNEYDSKSVEVIRKNNLAYVKSLYDNPQTKSVIKAIEHFKSKTGVKLLDENDLNVVDSSNLVELYNYVIKHDYIDIIICGNVDIDKTIDLVTKYAKFNTIKTHKLDFFIENKRSKKPIIKYEEADYEQAQIQVLLVYDNLTEYEKRYVATLYNDILGGAGFDSRLFKNVREKSSMCYSITSSFKRYDSIGLISTSVDPKNVKKAIKLIKSTLESMTDLKEQEIEVCKKQIISSLSMSVDDSERLSDSYLSYHYDILEPLNKRISAYSDITKKDLIKVAKKVHIEYIYVYGGKDNEKN